MDPWISSSHSFVSHFLDDTRSVIVGRGHGEERVCDISIQNHIQRIPLIEFMKVDWVFIQGSVQTVVASAHRAIILIVILQLGSCCYVSRSPCGSALHRGHPREACASSLGLFLIVCSARLCLKHCFHLANSFLLSVLKFLDTVYHVVEVHSDVALRLLSDPLSEHLVHTLASWTSTIAR